MNFNEYQDKARETDGNHDLPYYYLQLARESGEVLETFIKSTYHNHAGDLEKRKLELGDLLWFIAMIADKDGLTLQEIAESNIQKLNKRYENGYSDENSINREA